ncbi:MAG: hypothetical protein WCP19_11155 [Chloroflexota bacterium]
MNITSRFNTFELDPNKLMGVIISQRNKIFVYMIVGALVAFEIFNYSTTEFALSDVLGSLMFAGIHWSTILAIAFCGIDFAGVARLFSQDKGQNESTEIWYLLGAWILAAAMNATLTWWGVSVAIANHISQGTSVINTATLQTVVPIFVAVMVLVIRIMIIGTFSAAGDRMFDQAEGIVRKNQTSQQNAAASKPEYSSQRTSIPAVPALSARPVYTPGATFRSPTRSAMNRERTFERNSEPTYHNIGSGKQSERLEANG